MKKAFCYLEEVTEQKQASDQFVVSAKTFKEMIG